MTEKATKTLEILKGELTHKEEKQSSNNKTYWLLEIEGVGKASVWDKKVTELLKIGKTYEYEAEVDGRYTTVKSVKEVTSIVQESPPPKQEIKQPSPPSEHKEAYIPASKNDQAIMSQVALKSAVERANGITGRELTTAEIISMGQEFMIAMKAWSIGKVVLPIVKSFASASPASKVESTTTKQPEDPPEGKQGPVMANENQLKLVLELGHRLPGFKGKTDDDIIRSVCTSIRAEDWNQAVALDVAGIIANWENYLKPKAKVPAQAKIMPMDSEEPF